MLANLGYIIKKFIRKNDLIVYYKNKIKKNMKEFKLNEKDYKMPTDWKEMTLAHYVELSKLEENKTKYLFGELYLLKVIENLCMAEPGELDDLTLDIVNELSEALVYLQQEPTWANSKHIRVGEIDYVFPPDLNKLTMGEYISMKTLQEQSITQSDAIPFILAVILRPGKLVKDEESGKENWIQDKFDANNIEYRKNLFMTLPVFDLMGPVSFFLNGNGTSMSNLRAYTVVPE
jgi:hypothetical protein